MWQDNHDSGHVTCKARQSPHAVVVTEVQPEKPEKSLAVRPCPSRTCVRKRQKDGNIEKERERERERQKKRERERERKKKRERERERDRNRDR